MEDERMKLFFCIQAINNFYLQKWNFTIRTTMQFSLCRYFCCQLESLCVTFLVEVSKVSQHCSPHDSESEIMAVHFWTGNPWGTSSQWSPVHQHISIINRPYQDLSAHYRHLTAKCWCNAIWFNTLRKLKNK